MHIGELAVVVSLLFLFTGPLLVLPIVAARLRSNCLMVNLAAALLLGTMVSAWAVFLVAIAIGFTGASVLLVTATLTLACICLYLRPSVRRDLKKCAGALYTPPSIWLPSLFLGLYFGLSLWQTPDGATWYAANYTDFPFHLAQVNTFSTLGEIPPEHPQAAGCTMAYHFMVNFHSACLLKLGMPLVQSVQFPNLLFAASLGVLLGAFFRRFCASAQAAGWAIILFLFNKASLGNLLAYVLGQNPGGYHLALDAQMLRGLRGIALFPFFNFDDPIINLFHPQRPMLLGFGVSLILYILLRDAIETDQHSSRKTLALMGINLGLMPLFHAPSFMVVFLSGIIILLIRRLPRAAAMLASISLPLALPQLIFLQSLP